ncbi:MAG: tripartite tricarboxylate transporter substrate binding protein [Pseudomonadota bacterium]
MRALTVVAALLIAAPAFAQQRDAAADYPSRTVKILVSAPPGGGPDIAARIVAEKLRQMWGQPVIVENRPGNAGNLGAEAVSLAPPDGYTILSAQPSPLTTSMHLYAKLGYDPLAFEPIAVMTSFPNLLLVRPDFPANSFQEFVTYAKANPEKVNYASQGIGTTPHLTGEWFQRATGTKLVHVPYRGTAQAVNDLIASHVDMMFLELAAATELAHSGRAKILAIAARERVASMPNVPTLGEHGYPIESLAWNALAAPPKTPQAIVAKINAAVNEVFKAPDTAAQFANLKMQTVGGTPAHAAEFFKIERQRWGEVIRAANITVH